MPALQWRLIIAATGAWCMAHGVRRYIRTGGETMGKDEERLLAILREQPELWAAAIRLIADAAQKHGLPAAETEKR